MTFTLITKKADIQAAYALLSSLLTKSAIPIEASVGDASGRKNYTVYWHPDHGIWIIAEAWMPRATNAFGVCIGTDDPNDYKKHLNITSEMNMPKEGFNRRTGGLFVTDENGSTYLAHTGVLGGQQKGVGKKAFLAFYPNSIDVRFPDNKTEPLYLIGELSANLVSDIAVFVRRVHAFKTMMKTGTTIVAKLDEIAEEEKAKGAFSFSSFEDARKRTMASIVLRRGQPKFRNALLKAYGNRCAISGCDLVEALEAAHVYPYRGDETNQVCNGILLRSDLHTLFDLGLIEVDADEYTVVLAKSLRKSVYKEFDGRKVDLPCDTEQWPNKELLKQRSKIVAN